MDKKQEHSRRAAAGTTYIVETEDGFQVSVPAEKLEVWQERQREGSTLTSSEQQVRDKIVSMLYGRSR